MKLYKGRVPEDPSPLMDKINRSLPFDIRLFEADVATNRAWARALTTLGVFNNEELQAVEQRLDDILKMYQNGAFEIIPDDEDIHTLTERLLTEALGGVGARIHTGRSRNDQVVTDLRQYVGTQIDALCCELLALIDTLADRAEEHADTLLAGTTHMQPALPVTLGHFLCSLAFALQRDYGRFNDSLKRVRISPLGAGAMAGSGFPVDRHSLASELGFHDILNNSIDAVSDRDFCIEPVMNSALLGTHLSRYAEQFIVWANPAFGYVRFSGQWSTGSSMMPQKRNPDAMELIRGKAARMIGATSTLLSLMKGLPLSYAKDLQEDKEPLFDVLDTALLLVAVFREAVKTAQFFPEKMERALTTDMLATDLADALARAGVPFRDAHERVGALVSECEAADTDLGSVNDAALKKHFPEFGDDLPKLNFQESVAQRYVTGGTAPSSVHEQIAILRKFTKEQNV